MEQILIDEYLGIPATYAEGGRVGFKTGGIANRNMIATLFNRS